MSVSLLSTKLYCHFQVFTMPSSLFIDTLQDLRIQDLCHFSTEAKYRHLLHRTTGMPADSMTPVRAQDTKQQYNRSAESSVNGTIVLAQNKARPEYRSSPPAWSGGKQESWVAVQFTAQHNTGFVEVPE